MCVCGNRCKLVRPHEVRGALDVAPHQPRLSVLQLARVPVDSAVCGCVYVVIAVVVSVLCWVCVWQTKKQGEEPLDEAVLVLEAVKVVPPLAVEVSHEAPVGARAQLPLVEEVVVHLPRVVLLHKHRQRRHALPPGTLLLFGFVLGLLVRLLVLHLLFRLFFCFLFLLFTLLLDILCHIAFLLVLHFSTLAILFLFLFFICLVAFVLGCKERQQSTLWQSCFLPSLQCLLPEHRVACNCGHERLPLDHLHSHLLKNTHVN